MIRREFLRPPASDWLLITQPDHARLARELADAWGASGFLPLAEFDPQGELLAAVEHHDDGWQAADAAPALDPDAARPRDFLETPLVEALTIWEGSIRSAAQFGPLAGYLVTRHFQALVERGRHSPEQQQRIHDSLLGPAGPWRGWLAEWLAGDPARTAERAETGLHYLQMFDWLSLWLAMAPRRDPLEQPTPDGPALTIAPVEAGLCTVDPWPFRDASLTVRVAGRAVPQQRYEDTPAVLAALGPSETLTWRFEPLPEELDLTRLRGETFLRHAEHHRVVGSTNDVARERAQSGVELPSLVSADRQTAGRGRGANRWWTGHGSLACTLLLDPTAWRIAAADGPLVSLAVATALVETLAPRVDDASGQEVGLHWPNDVFVGGQKIAGILIERLGDGRLIIGFGLNVNNTLADAPHEILAVAVTLRDLTGRRYDRTEILVDFLRRLQETLVELGRDPGEVVQRADGLCLQHGRLLTLDTGREQVTGVCRGLDVDGAIVLETPGGPRRFLGGVLRH